MVTISPLSVVVILSSLALVSDAFIGILQKCGPICTNLTYGCQTPKTIYATNSFNCPQYTDYICLYSGGIAYLCVVQRHPMTTVPDTTTTVTTAAAPTTNANAVSHLSPCLPGLPSNFMAECFPACPPAYITIDPNPQNACPLNWKCCFNTV